MMFVSQVSFAFTVMHSMILVRVQFGLLKIGLDVPEWKRAFSIAECTLTTCVHILTMLGYGVISIIQVCVFTSTEWLEIFEGRIQLSRLQN